ncbi:hypothetical protein PVAND_001680 [Polypedilum vanderplanki]|uniref:Glucose-methanol-choline oxidoreductase N-terminal domain-containing protein n=1 Tax=Polypedilum vanderplanki TaxID=319348 RepID=A0A9J6BPZ5_POLVA|nr:hypothetical protein PVAND_001680 [Polypedilum vanderplanki]
MLAIDFNSIPISALALLLALIAYSSINPDFTWPTDQLTTQYCTYDTQSVFSYNIKLPWTAKCTDTICTQVKNNKTISFDYIIVGAGTSGALLAYRLVNAQPGRTVLLIEAGGDPLAQSVPPRLFPNTLNNSATFNFTAAFNPNASQAYEKGSNANSGKALGGSTTTSTMTSVCGNDKDFAEWADLVKDSSWNYANFKQYLKKHENMLDNSLTSGKCANYHSTSGPIGVSDVGETVDWFSPTLKNAFQEKNYSALNDINCGGPYTGYANVRMYINKGQRETTAHACLTKLTEKSNFILLKNTFVKSVIASNILGVVTVKGVNVHTTQSGCENFQIFANREVILTTGAQNTPKILLQSGIGRSKDLCPNVSQILSLSVGYNHMDHVSTIHFFSVPESNNSEIVQTINFTAKAFSEGVNYLLTQNGYFSYFSGWNLQAFVNVTQKSSSYPDIVYNFARFDQCIGDFNLTLNNYGFKQEFIKQIYDASRTNSILMVSNILQKPQSSGTVKLGSCSDPLANPTINANFLSNSNDTDTLLKGMNELYALMNTTTMVNYGVKDLMINITECNAFKRYSDAYNRCYMKYFSNGERNVCGTAKMGNSNDNDAVVDKNLKVYGVTKTPFTANLRIVDASIFPKITMGDISCVVFGVTEKAADLIIADNP